MSRWPEVSRPSLGSPILTLVTAAHHPARYILLLAVHGTNVKGDAALPA